MLHFHDVLCTKNDTPVRARCGFNMEFIRDVGYCIDAPRWVPAGSTQRFDPDEVNLLLGSFAAPSIAFRY